MKVRILDRKSFNIVLFESMVALVGEQDLGEVFGLTANGYETEVDMQVAMTVNGITVPFTEALEAAVNRMYNTFDENFDKLVDEAAMKKVTGSKLAELMQEIESSEWRIRDILNKTLD